jgi:ribosomal-protein-alanine N-acetyltransferase
MEREIFSDPWSASAFRDLEAALFVVAEADAKVVGYLVGRTAADEGEILNLAVGSGHRGKGVGRALVDHALSTFREHGVGMVYLEVRDSNGVAQRFYQGVGFKEVGRRRGYYDRPREDARILALEIGPA